MRTVVDAQTGKVARDHHAVISAGALSEPMHFGNYGGLPLKLLGTRNLLTLFITGSGAWLFFDRRRARSLRSDL